MPELLDGFDGSIKDEKASKRARTPDPFGRCCRKPHAGVGHPSRIRHRSMGGNFPGT